MLCNPKFKLLQKNPNKPVFLDTDQIRLNVKFASPTIRLSLLPAKTVKKQTAGASEEEKKEKQRIERERTFVV